MRNLLKYLFMVVAMAMVFIVTRAYLEVFGFSGAVIPSVILMIYGSWLMIKAIFYCSDATDEDVQD